MVGESLVHPCACFIPVTAGGPYHGVPLAAKPFCEDFSVHGDNPTDLKRQPLVSVKFYLGPVDRIAREKRFSNFSAAD